MRSFVARHLGGGGVLKFDETGDLKKGDATAGVGRQYSGDEVYGRSGELRALFEERGIGYVFAIGCDFTITTSGRQPMRADQALHLVAPSGWNRRSAGHGAKGPRYYDWAWTATTSPRHHRHGRLRAVGSHRRSSQGHAPGAPVLPNDADQTSPADCGMIALTVPELQRLLPILLPEQVSPASGIDFHLRWSNWRRRHQARARWHHYQRRFAPRHDQTPDHERQLEC